MHKYIILFVVISVLSGANSLQCYRCTDCPEVKSEHLVTCGANTTLTTTTTTQKPNTSTTTTTTTQTPNTNTTSTTTTTTTTPNPNTNTTTSTTTTTTTQKPDTNTTTSNTTTTTTTTTTQTPNTNSTVNETQGDSEALRFRRSAEGEYNDDCFCNYDGECNCHGLRIIQFRDEKATESYVCVKDILLVNGSTVINRGCAVKHNQTQQTCVGSAFSSNCTVCDTDKCNDASSINFSILVLVTTFLTAVNIV